MWTILKILIEFVTILLLFYILVFWLPGIWDLHSLTRDGTHVPCIGRRSLSHWTTREVFWFLCFLIQPCRDQLWCFQPPSPPPWFKRLPSHVRPFSESSLETSTSFPFSSPSTYDLSPEILSHRRLISLQSSIFISYSSSHLYAFAASSS